MKIGDHDSVGNRSLTWQSINRYLSPIDHRIKITNSDIQKLYFLAHKSSLQRKNKQYCLFFSAHQLPIQNRCLKSDFILMIEKACPIDNYFFCLIVQPPDHEGLICEEHHNLRPFNPCRVNSCQIEILICCFLIGLYIFSTIPPVRSSNFNFFRYIFLRYF